MGAMRKVTARLIQENHWTWEHTPLIHGLLRTEMVNHLISIMIKSLSLRLTTMEKLSTLMICIDTVKQLKLGGKAHGKMASGPLLRIPQSPTVVKEPLYNVKKKRLTTHLPKLYLVFQNMILEILASERHLDILNHVI